MAEIGIKPLGAKVVIQTIEESDRTESGLYLSAVNKEKPQTGLLVAKGKIAMEDMDAKIGDTVLFPKYTGTEIKFNTIEYIVMDYEKVLAVL